MKKTTLLLLLLCAPTASRWLAVGAVPAPRMGGRDAIPVAALREGGRQTLGGKKADSGIAYLMPKIDADFSDLDVRDAQNNPIRNAAASQEIEDLFRQNLLNLTIFANPHIMTQMLNWLDANSHLFNKLILMRILAVFGAIQDALLPPIRRFVHNVHNLCTTFSVGVLAGSFLVSAFTLQRSPRNINLRC